VARSDYAGLWHFALFAKHAIEISHAHEPFNRYDRLFFAGHPGFSCIFSSKIIKVLKKMDIMKIKDYFLRTESKIFRRNK